MDVKSIITETLITNTKLGRGVKPVTIEDWVCLYYYSKVTGHGLAFKKQTHANVETFISPEQDVDIIGYGILRSTRGHLDAYGNANVSISEESKMIFKNCIEEYNLGIHTEMRKMCKYFGIKLDNTYHKDLLITRLLNNKTKRAETN